MTSEISRHRPPIVHADGTQRLCLTFAVSEYDHVRDLTSGVIQPVGATLNSLTLPIEEIAYRYFRNFEFDLAETSFAKFISLTAAGNAPIVGIPVFPARLFRHSAIYVRKDSSITCPKDLEGKAVGIAEWAQTAAVYVRGMLAETYEVPLDKVRWVQAGINQSGRVEKVSFNLPASYQYESRPEKSISEMLRSGEIDAAIVAKPPNSYLADDGIVARLFPNYHAEEMAYYEATKIFPIAHLISMRRAIFDAYPWIARNLQTAFERAKDAAVARLLDINTSRAPLPWGAALASDMAAKMGGDLWPYGVEANRLSIDAFCRFAHQQYLTPTLLTADDLFPAEVIGSFRV